MILTPEARALLKRMDADDAIERAAQLGWNAAIEAIEKRLNNLPRYIMNQECLRHILALKDSK